MICLLYTSIAGTTRDSIYTRYNKFGFDFYLVDTAGIRKKNKAVSYTHLAEGGGERLIKLGDSSYSPKCI